MKAGFASRAAIGTFAVLASAIAIALFLQVSPTLAQTPVDAFDDHRIVQERPLTQVQRRIWALIRADNYENFTGMAFDHENQEVILYWKGILPPAFESLVRDPQLEARVRVVTRDYSEDELRQEGARIARLDLSQYGITISYTASSSGFQGIKVAITSADAIPAARQIISSYIPLEFSEAAQSIPYRTRWDDDSPFWAGAAIERTGVGNGCTTGFAVTVSSTEGIVTAGHCGASSAWETVTGATDVGDSGSLDGASPTTDSMVITGGDYAPVMHSGAYNVSPAVPRFIDGVHEPAVNDYVVVSGAFSGAWAVRVNEVNVNVNSIGVGIVGPGFWTVDDNGYGSAGEGDSGGPVADPAATPNHEDAAGMIQGGDPTYNTTCKGYDGGRDCSSVVFHVHFQDILDAHSATIQTY